MAYNDWNKAYSSQLYWLPNNAEGQILDYTGSAGIPAPTSSVGTQGRTFRALRGSNAGNNSIEYIYHQVSSSVSSSMFDPIVSSSAYSVSTWVRFDRLGGASLAQTDQFFGCGITIKTRDANNIYNSEWSLNSSATIAVGHRVGYRLLLTNDGLSDTPRTDGNLNLKLCGRRWNANTVLCSGSYAPGNWYRIKLELFEKQNVPSIKSDELYAYLYNTGSQTWQQVGYLSLPSTGTDYLSWGNTYKRVGIAHGVQSNNTSGYNVLFSYDGLEISQVPWDKDNPT